MDIYKLAQLRNAYESDADGFFRSYLDNFRFVQAVYSNDSLRRGSFRTANEFELLRIAKIGAVLNDVTFLTFDMSDMGPRGHINILKGEAFERVFGSERVRLTVPTAEVRKLRRELEKNNVSLGFCLRTDGLDFVTRQLAPLVARGHSFLQLPRFIIYGPEDYSAQQRTLKAFEVSPDSPTDSWHVESNCSPPPIKMEMEEKKRSREKLAFDLVVPFIDGMSTSTLADILRDEADILGEFRSSIRELIGISFEHKIASNEFRRDVLDPRIAKLERRFNHICNLNRLKLGGASVGMATMSLVGLSTGGITAAISAVAGAGGLLYLAKEAADIKVQKELLKDDPAYLLWKLKRVPINRQ